MDRLSINKTGKKRRCVVHPRIFFFWGKRCDCLNFESAVCESGNVRCFFRKWLRLHGKIGKMLKESGRDRRDERRQAVRRKNREGSI